MPTPEESSLKKGDNPKTLGVIAGGGVLPARLIYACEQKGITPFVIGFEGQTDYTIITAVSLYLYS